MEVGLCWNAFPDAFALVASGQSIYLDLTSEANDGIDLPSIRLAANIVSISSGMANVTFDDGTMFSKLRKSPFPLCQAATWVAWNVSFPSSVQSLISIASAVNYTVNTFLVRFWGI